MIGEFSTTCSESHDSVKNHKYLYENGYSGALAWKNTPPQVTDSCTDKNDVLQRGLSAIAHLTSNGKVALKI